MLKNVNKINLKHTLLNFSVQHILAYRLHLHESNPLRTIYIVLIYMIYINFNLMSTPQKIEYF